MDTKVKDLVNASMSKIHEMADANTVLGNPLKLDGGVTVIPVSKVSYGFASGGSDLPSKSGKELFGGASGAGVTISPLGFLVISGGDVQLLQLNLDVSTSSAIVNMVPDVFNKVASLFKKDKHSESSDKQTSADTDTIELPKEMLADNDTGENASGDFDF